MPEPNTNFEWSMYANATFAGLSPLIPLPVLDWVFEEFFRRRIAPSVARNRGRRLLPRIYTSLHSRTESCLAGCWLWPVWLLMQLLKSISRKLFYVLSIKEATDKVSYYWQMAFLTDYMLASGLLEDPWTALLGRVAMDRTLRGAATSPLNSLAGQITQGMQHSLRSLLKARKGEENAEIRAQKVKLIQGWNEYSSYLRELAQTYDRIFAEVQASPPFPRPPSMGGSGETSQTA